MGTNIELSPRECMDLIAGGVVGRVALWTPGGPQIFPVNFIVRDRHIIFRTTPYSTLGIYSWNTDVAFEVDKLDSALQQGWSVVVFGRAETIDDPDEVAEIRMSGGPTPWAEGPRRLYVRIPMTRVTGRRVGTSWLAS